MAGQLGKDSCVFSTDINTVLPKQRGGGDMHCVMPETVMEELRAAGFVDLQLVPKWHSRLFLVHGSRLK